MRTRLYLFRPAPQLETRFEFSEYGDRYDNHRSTGYEFERAHPGTTLAALYDPDLMPPNLSKAHHALDRAVDRLYRRGDFASERGASGTSVWVV